MRDYHLHTTYSPDGNAQMREQIRAAVDAGLEEICITDHLDLKHHEAIFDVPVVCRAGGAARRISDAVHKGRHRGRRAGLRNEGDPRGSSGASV